MPTPKHRCEIIPVKPGSGKDCTAFILDRFAAEGWEVLLLEAWPVKTGGSKLTDDEKVELGLLVVMRKVQGP